MSTSWLLWSPRNPRKKEVTPHSITLKMFSAHSITNSTGEPKIQHNMQMFSDWCVWGKQNNWLMLSHWGVCFWTCPSASLTKRNSTSFLSFLEIIFMAGLWPLRSITNKCKNCTCSTLCWSSMLKEPAQWAEWLPTSGTHFGPELWHLHLALRKQQFLSDNCVFGLWVHWNSFWLLFGLWLYK